MEGQPAKVTGTTTVHVTLEEKQQGNQIVNCVNVDQDEIDVQYGHQQTINWVIDTGTYPNATITGLSFTPANTAWAIGNLGTASVSIVDDDENQTGADKVWNYTLTVNYGGKIWESDPKIINKPDTGSGG